MRELFSPSRVVPALIIAEICIPFSVLLAPTVYWRPQHAVVLVTVSVGLGLVLAAYVLLESIRHASLLAGALVGIWAAVVGFWPALILESAARSAQEMFWNPRPMWASMLDMVPRMLEYAALGLGIGLAASLVPWLVHRKESHPAAANCYPRRTGWLLVITIIFAFAPLLAALSVTRRLDWLLQQYAAGIRWAAVAQTLFTIETVSRTVLLALAAVAAGLFLLRNPAARVVTVILLVLAVVAAVFRWASLPGIPLLGDADGRQFQKVLDIADIAACLLAGGLGIPYFLRSRRLRAMTVQGNTNLPPTRV